MMNKDDNNDKISKALKIPPLDNFKKQLSLPENGKYQDMDIAKENIKDIINKGTESFDELMEIAKSSQHPRAFEVLANLMRVIVDANRNLVDINIRENNIKVLHDNRQINQNFFYGTTNDMLKQLRGGNGKDVISGEVEDND
jgi:hypothetical protein